MARGGTGRITVPRRVRTKARSVRLPAAWLVRPGNDDAAVGRPIACLRLRLPRLGFREPRLRVGLGAARRCFLLASLRFAARGALRKARGHLGARQPRAFEVDEAARAIAVFGRHPAAVIEDVAECQLCLGARRVESRGPFIGLARLGVELVRVRPARERQPALDVVARDAAGHAAVVGERRARLDDAQDAGERQPHAAGRRLDDHVGGGRLDHLAVELAAALQPHLVARARCQPETPCKRRPRRGTVEPLP